MSQHDISEAERDADYARFVEMEGIKRRLHILLANKTFLTVEETYRLSWEIFDIFMNSNIPGEQYLKTYKGDKL